LTERVLLGAVVAAHGIKGEVRVKTFTLAPESLGAYGPLTTGSGRTLSIASIRPMKQSEMIVAFAGVADRNQAESLKGEGLYVARAQLPELEAGEFYQADLIGLKVEDSGGKDIGVVRAIHNFGAGDLIEIERVGGESEFIPLSDESVTRVDIAGGRIVIVNLSEAEEG
jgi:16S rRNA processing protein RimM